MEGERDMLIECLFSGEGMDFRELSQFEKAAFIAGMQHAASVALLSGCGHPNCTSCIGGGIHATLKEEISLLSADSTAMSRL